jgi:hypothetical protein
MAGLTPVDLANAAALNQAVSLIRQQLSTNDTNLEAALNAILAKFTNGLTALRLLPTAFSNLPASPAAGWVAYCTGGNTNTWGANVTGAGAFPVLVWWNGSHWTVVGT